MRAGISQAASQPLTWIIVVAAVYAIAQLVLLDVGRYYEWDEALYVAQVSPFADAGTFFAHRARGITLLVAPIAVVTNSIVALRLYLSIAAAAALALSFGLWVRVIGWGAVAAEGLFAITWLALLYGGEVSPNLWVAFAGLGVVGLSIRYVARPSWGTLVSVATAMAIAALLRPSDALFIGIASLAAAILVKRRLVDTRLGFSIAGGFLVGMLPWVVEAYSRFGGPLARLAEARRIVGGELTFNVAAFVGLADGPLTGPEPNPTPSVGAVVWLALLFTAVFFGAVRPAGLRWVAIASIVSSAILALPYLFYTVVVAPRFVLPAYALMACAAGVGVVGIYRRTQARQLGMVVTAAIIAIAAWHVVTASEIGGLNSLHREAAVEIGAELAFEAHGHDCVFMSQYSHPQIAFASGCRGERWVIDDPAAGEQLAGRAGDDGVGFAVSIGEPPVGSSVASWPSRVIVVSSGGKWILYRQPAG